MLGFFAEYRLPVDDQEAAAAQWQRYGLIDNEAPDELHDTSSVCCTGLNIGLTEHRKVKRATLVFHCESLQQVMTTLAKLDIEPRRVEESAGVAWLRSPEGLDIAVIEVSGAATAE